MLYFGVNATVRYALELVSTLNGVRRRLEKHEGMKSVHLILKSRPSFLLCRAAKVRYEQVGRQDRD